MSFFFNINSPILRQYALAIIVNLNVLSAGLGLAWTSPVLVKLSNTTDNPLPEPITENEGAWIVSIGFLCGGIVNFLAGYLIHKLGRKATLLIGAVPKIFSYVMLVMANRVWMLYVGRIAGSVSDAFTFAVVPMYTAEIASKEIRGALGTFLQLFCSLGVLIMLSMGPYVSYLTLNIICTVIVVATAIPLIFIPDSPYFLYSVGRKEEALKTLIFLQGSEASAQEEMKILEVATSNKDKTKLFELLRSATVLKALGIVLVLGFGIQATGYNAVAFYLQTILESTKTGVSSQLASVIIGIIQLVASLCTTVFTDRFGRKPIVAWTLAGMSLGLMGLGAFFKLSDSGYSIDGFVQYLPLVSLIIIVYSYSAGIGCLIWLLFAELFDGPVRALGVTMGLMSTTLFLFLCTKFFASMISTLGAATTYWIFGVNSILFCVFILFCMPETKGRTFAEIQKALGHKENRDTTEKA